MEVKEYIRTPYGSIEKIVRIIKESNWICIETDKSAYDLDWLNRCNTKHSKQLIDLIEIYDYVNSFLVFDIITYIDGTKIVKLTNGNLISNDEIESVVTKEKFESVEYEVRK